jgi:myo-inositol 2-dehydrogenase/D-chiro-inositol 1-dehydrogenase
MELFIDALVNDKEMPVGGEDGLQATLIAVAAKTSMQEGRPVKLSEISLNN